MAIKRISQKQVVSYANIDHSCKILNITQNSFNNRVTKNIVQGLMVVSIYIHPSTKNSVTEKKPVDFRLAFLCLEASTLVKCTNIV